MRSGISDASALEGRNRENASTSPIPVLSLKNTIISSKKFEYTPKNRYLCILFQFRLILRHLSGLYPLKMSAPIDIEDATLVIRHAKGTTKPSVF
jgi:hypothetical protein